jgi:surface antigen
MQAPGAGFKAWLLGSALLFGCPLVTHSAQADQNDVHGRATVKPTTNLQAHPIGTRVTLSRGANATPAMHYAARVNDSRPFLISCVPYARQVSGIQVIGNAWEWWNNAAGVYARGTRPESGSVLNFRANGRMRLGHVAVVTKVVNPREVIVDHANWPSTAMRGAVSRNIAVVDVSEANNWSAVRVELGHSGNFGSIYPTYGFIYKRPDSGTMVSSLTPPAPQAVINPVPSDLRPRVERPWHTVEEVAESPAHSRRIDLTIKPATFGPSP